jgi:ABC-2 type transport system permease protein
MSKDERFSFFNTVKQGAGDVLYIWGNELKTVLKDQGIRIFFFIVPLIYPVIYTLIYNPEVVRDVPVVVIDNSHSFKSREYIRKVDATSDVKVVCYAADMSEARQIMREKGAYGIIYIPTTFAKDIYRMEQAHISIYYDMSGLLYYRAILMACNAVSLDMNNDIKVERSGNTTEREDEVTRYPINYESVTMFNPQNGFATFLIPAVLILVIQQTLVLGVGLSAGTAREKNQFKDLVPINNHYNGTLRIVFGKGLCYFIIYALDAVYVLRFIPWVFKLDQIAQPWTLIGFIVPFLIACIFFAMTCSIFVRTREVCFLIFLFCSVPLLFISGISWPGTAVPPFWKIVSYVFPSTFGINGFARISGMGATLSEVKLEYQALWLQAGFYFITTCVVYRWQILNSRIHVIRKYKEMKKAGYTSLSNVQE